MDTSIAMQMVLKIKNHEQEVELQCDGENV